MYSINYVLHIFTQRVNIYLRIIFNRTNYIHYSVTSHVMFIEMVTRYNPSFSPSMYHPCITRNKSKFLRRFCISYYRFKHSLDFIIANLNYLLNYLIALFFIVYAACKNLSIYIYIV